MLAYFVTILAELVILRFIQSNPIQIDSTGLCWGMIGIASLVFLITIIQEKDNKFVLTMIGSYLFRISLLIFDLYGRNIFVLPNSGLDSELFQRESLCYALNGGDVSMTAKTFGLFYRYFGEHRIYLQYLNLVLSILTLYIIWLILKKLDLDKKIRHTVFYITAFLPNYAILSVILLRESIIIFLLTCSMYFFVEWWKHHKNSAFILAVLLSLLAAMYHSGGITNAVGYVLIYILYDTRGQKYQLSFKTFLFSLLFFLGFFYLFNHYGNTFFSYVDNVNSLDDITRKVVDAGGGGSGYDYIGGANIDSLGELILYSPIRMFYFIASPLPWMWRGINDMIAFLFSALFYLTSLYMGFQVLFQRMHSKNKNLIFALILICVIGMALFAWGVSNAGTALRHRDKFLIDYVILFAVSYQEYLNSHHTKHKITTRGA
ncbi:phospholipid carrier-dependent glycosyltransferase [Niameybacter massiliensis]|uniref:Phospholipid carrier-dependent glycosyltransferase n=1 Tax=Holtiella tumoricola TaxID=3018743 RepID=A0AA42J0F4_9FIRM|nr:phospholipid carrier-dependent glycosyltransferase [Holtiella tumoricola]MDA3731284.1 phospholipid carrier-dependent glycosyltransferase [Holtiella tumoricola]